MTKMINMDELLREYPQQTVIRPITPEQVEEEVRAAERKRREVLENWLLLCSRCAAYEGGAR